MEISLIIVTILLIITLIAAISACIRYDHSNIELAETRKAAATLQLKVDELHKQISELSIKHQQAITTARADAIVKSKAVTRGQVVESFIPFTIGNLNPRDFKHLGDPIDYIVFSGVYNSRDTEPTVNEILFVEVKTSKSRLTKVQRAVRDCIKNNRVRFLTLNPDKELKKDINEETPRYDNS